MEKIYILYTGGTIGSITDSQSGALRPGSLAELVPHLGLQLVDGHYRFTCRNGQVATVEMESLATPIDSSSLRPEHWNDIAAKIEAVYDDYDGFVILHGTDTLAYTASALAFMFDHLAKPVVVTGSQCPISHPKTDAVRNFVNALHVAAHQTAGLPLVAEVMVVFADSVLRGCRTDKVSASRWAGFASPNCRNIGDIDGENIVIHHSMPASNSAPGPASTPALKPASKSEHQPISMHGSEFSVARLTEVNVLDIVITPALSASVFQQLLSLQSVQGVVLQTYGSGNMPNDAPFLDAIQAAIRSGKVIVNITQCLHGTVEMGVYETSAELVNIGVISGTDMTPAAALTKVMWALSTHSQADWAAAILANQRDELTPLA